MWLSWGLNFGWKASRALLFGLAVNGVNSHSPVVQGDPMGPFWLTGGGFGLEGSWVTFIVLIAALPLVFRVTRDLDFRYNAPVIVPGGIPVDLDAAARAQHEAAMGAAAARRSRADPDRSCPAPPPPPSRYRPQSNAGRTSRYSAATQSLALRNLHLTSIRLRHPPGSTCISPPNGAIFCSMLLVVHGRLP